MNITGMFDSSGIRVLLHLGGNQVQPRWHDGGPATGQQAPKYSRTVSSDGLYATRVSCAFGEEFDLPWPKGQRAPERLCADVWLERRTVLERLDSLLGAVGLGSSLPAYDRTWLGRVVAPLPPEGEDVMPKAWPVVLSPDGQKETSGPAPKSLSLGAEWPAATPSGEG